MSELAYEPVKQSDEDLATAGKVNRSPIFSRRPRITAFTVICGVLLITLYYFYPIGGAQVAWSESPVNASQDKSTKGLPQCISPEPLVIKARPSIWKNLEVVEAALIREWLFREELGLNLTRADKARTADNYIYLLENFRPKKSDALSYLDKEGEAPKRLARVTIQHGALKEPVIRDYLVGPLPLSDDTRITQLTSIYHVPDIPFNARGFTRIEDMFNVVLQFIAPIAEATKELLGGVALGYPNDTLVGAAYAPFSFDGSFRRMWLAWKQNVAGPWLHTLNFFQYVSMDGNDPSKWKILKVVYNHQIFDSVDAFMQSFRNGTLKRLPLPDWKNTKWSSRERRGPQRDLDNIAGPRSVSFNGPRFRVDKEQQYITWMGWSMYLGFDRDMGLSLWDINFQGERIIYELAPQEALAQYAGNDPMQTTTVWLDRYFGMGEMTRNMLPGYDCPNEAVYLPATVHTALGSQTQDKAICVFEMDSGRPISRHMGFVGGEFGSIKGYVLTVRAISTVGNYDYMFDYMFHLDGTIEVRVSASGYLQAGYWEPLQTGYGTRIQDQTMGSLHDHVINFKVDLDIAGTANSLLQTTTSVEEVTKDWFEDDWDNTVIQQHITQKYIATEDDSKLKYPANFQGGYAFVNRNESNAWGNPRGYAIHPGYSPVHNTVVGSKRALNNVNWARYNLAVTRRKDDEPSSSSMWNINLPGKPPVDFHKFFDGESLDQEDLVAWINVGTHHLPSAEDVPNTRTTTAASSFMITPLNYFDWDITLDSTNAVLLTPPEVSDGVYTYEDYGVKAEYCVPPPHDPFTYGAGVMYGLDGKKAPPRTAEQQRAASEISHRIKVEM